MKDMKNITYNLKSKNSVIYHFKLASPLTINAPKSKMLKAIFKSNCVNYKPLLPQNAKDYQSIKGKLFSAVFNKVDFKEIVEDFTKNELNASGFVKVKINKRIKNFFNPLEGVVKKANLLKFTGLLLKYRKNNQL